ncbi:MAG TPA: serpin family protein, partial [Polyangiaceae bacterium]|nr:serpin family protein [Polyangiaceae bacterium]
AALSLWHALCSWAGMRHLLSAASLLLLASTAACSNTAAHPTTQGSPPDVSVDQLDIPRDGAGTLPAGAVAGAVTANNAFAFDLYAHVLAAQATPGNTLTSPISASLALTMTYAGAEGQTATEMATALHYGAAAGSIFDGQNGLSQALASRGASALAGAQKTAGESGQPAPSAGDFQLEVVNSVWGEQTYPWAQPFLTTLAKSYGTGVYVEDFVHQWDPARLAINAWVSTETSDKINDLLAPGSLDDTTRLVLVNAIHLKLPWASPFQVSATAAAPFTRADGSTVSAPFMNQVEPLAYTDDGTAQLVAIPLSGGQVSVVIALPHGDLAAYEAGLTAATPNALAPPTSSVSVALSLPKMTFTSPTFSLAKPLQAMGMVQAFDPQAANLTGMCPATPDGDNLYVGDVEQKAMVAMQESGVEAAAATAVIVGGASVAEPAPTPMVVDRPFVLALVDVPTGALLFLGHVEDPTDAGSQ